MSRAALLTALAAVVLGATAMPVLASPSAPSGSRATTSPSCGIGAGHTLAQTSSGRVYTLNESVYGCAIPRGVPYRLGSQDQCLGTALAGPVALVGNRVAYGLESCTGDTSSSVVIVRRLIGFKVLRRDPAMTGTAVPEPLETVQSVVLRSDNSDAWIAVAVSAGSVATATEVHAHGHHGASLLDSGATINPHSLKLQGSKLTWRHGARRRSATLK